MPLRRLVVIVLSVVGAALLAIVLYVAVADLGRHKGHIEALVTKQIGRPFVIDGALKLKLFPSVSVLAERVRVGNAEWGSKPQMVEIGHFSTNVGLWSLISGPVDIRSFELNDVSVLLERNADGKGNWEFGTESEEATPSESATKIPAVIVHGKLGNVEVTYREPGVPDRVALVETLTIDPGTDGLLAIAGNGRFDQYRTALDGHVGPIDALFSGRNIRVAVKGAIERLQLDINGSLGRLNPLTGADVTLKLEHPDLGKMLENLRLPVVATGTLNVDARLKDAGKLTQLDVDAKLGDITAKSNGTLRTLGLPGSDLRFEVSVADAARLAKVFDVEGVPAEALTVSAHVASSPEEIKLDEINAKLAGAQVSGDGTLRLARERGADFRFKLGVENLMRLRKGLPELPLSVSGNYVDSRDKLELKNLRSRLGKTEISGWASMARNDKKKHIEADLASPLIDLTPFSKKKADGNAKTTTADGASASPADAKPPAKKDKGKYVFSDAPLKLDGLKHADAKLHFAAKEVKLASGMLKDVDGTLVANAGQLAFDGRAKGGIEGTLKSAVKLKSTSDGAADVEVNLDVKNMRGVLAAGEGLDPSLVPATSIDANLRASGVSARKLASSANGQLMLTQGPGKTKSGFLGMFGGGIFAQLASKLNPFAAQDPYTQLDCTVARVDIVDGHATVEPVLMQSQKVTITAEGKVNLQTEELTVDFNTRPREGIGVSPGMFTNPFIKLEGTLASPRIAVGAKGAASGALAAATAGASVVAKGLVDRARGEADMCKTTLEEAARGAAPADGSAKESANP